MTHALVIAWFCFLPFRFSQFLNAQSIPALLPSMKAEDWPTRRKAILEGMQLVMGKLPSRDSLPPPSTQVVSYVDFDPEILIQTLRFESEPDVWVPAYLLIPKGESKLPRPAVLCLHQTIPIGKREPAGLEGSPNLHYAMELARRGFIAIAPDYPSFGEYRYDFTSNRKWNSGSLKAVWDNMRAIDLLVARTDVDATKIGCIGHSLGGHNTIFTSVFDERIQVAVSSCGFTRFHNYYGGKLRGWTSDRYMPRIATEYDMNPDRVPFDFPQLIAAIAPRAFFSNSLQHDDNFDYDGVRESIESARSVFKVLGVEDNLQVVYPDCGHDFPLEAREAAYRFLEDILR